MNKFPFSARRFSLNYQFTSILRFYFSISMLISSCVAVRVSAPRSSPVRSMYCWCVQKHEMQKLASFPWATGEKKHAGKKSSRTHAIETVKIVFTVYISFFCVFLVCLCFLGRRLLCICKKTILIFCTIFFMFISSMSSSSSSSIRKKGCCVSVCDDYLSVGNFGSIRWNFRRLPPRFLRRSSGFDGDAGCELGNEMALFFLLFINESGIWHCVHKWKKRRTREKKTNEMKVKIEFFGCMCAYEIKGKTNQNRRKYMIK